MIELTTAQQNLLMSSAKKNWTFDVYDGDNRIMTIPISKMVDNSLNIKEALCTAESIDYSSCEASTLTVKIANVDNSVLKGKKLVVTLSAQQPLVSLNMPMGVYYIDSAERENGTWFSKIIAFDGMVLFDVDVAEWYNALSFPITIHQLRSSLCAYVGVEEDDISLPCDGLRINKTISPSELRGRDVLRSICQLNGVFGHFDREGRLTYKSLSSESAITLRSSGEDHYKSGATHESWDVPEYNAVIVQSTENDAGIRYPEDSGNNALRIVDNFLTYDMSTADREIVAAGCYENACNHTYIVHSTPTQGRPWLEVGDMIVVDSDEGMFSTYILERTITGFQGLNDVYSAKGSETSDGVFSVQKEIEKLKLRESFFERTVEHSLSRISDLEIGFSEIEQSAEKLTVRVTTANGTLTTTIDGTSWGAVFTNNDNEVTSGLTFDFANSQFVFNGAGKFTGEINVADKFRVNENGDVTMLGSSYIYGGRYYASSDSGYLNMGSTGLNIHTSDGVTRIRVGFTENNSDNPYILLNSGDGNHDVPGVIKKFAHGLWIGNSPPLEAVGDFVPKTGYQGIYVSFDEFKTYVVSDSNMQAVYTGEAIAKFG